MANNILTIKTNALSEKGVLRPSVRLAVKNLVLGEIDLGKTYQVDATKGLIVREFKDQNGTPVYASWKLVVSTNDPRVEKEPKAKETQEIEIA